MNKAHLAEMLALQDKLNTRVDPSWRLRGNNWTRAIMVEGVEALEHYGWKWWKKQTPDIPQVQIELVDIWHFIMSFALEHNAADPVTPIVTAIEQSSEKVAHLMGMDTRAVLERLVHFAAAGDISVTDFLVLMQQTGLTWGGLYKMYLAKNVLNMFRQDHGYKEGTYIKDWNGAEDNVALASLVETAEQEPDGLSADRLYTQLEGIYAQLPRLRAVA